MTIEANDTLLISIIDAQIAEISALTASEVTKNAARGLNKFKTRLVKSLTSTSEKADQKATKLRQSVAYTSKLAAAQAAQAAVAAGNSDVESVAQVAYNAYVGTINSVLASSAGSSEKRAARLNSIVAVAWGQDDTRLEQAKARVVAKKALGL